MYKIYSHLEISQSLWSSTLCWINSKFDNLDDEREQAPLPNNKPRLLSDIDRVDDIDSLDLPAAIDENRILNQGDEEAHPA